jgi:alcohol dehydrogenase (cytochrome c)
LLLWHQFELVAAKLRQGTRVQEVCSILGKFAYAVPLAGGAGSEFTNATPLAEDGFLYITESWNVLYKIDARSGDFGRIVWRMDPKQDRQMRSRGAALWGNLVITGAGGFGNSPRIIATDKETGMASASGQ